MSNSPLIQCNNICKTYHMGGTEVRALDHINLSIETGEYVAILGPSGSGKSTLMNTLGCLDTPSAGTYLLDGRDVSDLNKQQMAQVRNEKIGFIFQSFNLLPHSSALDNVALPLVYRGTKLNERRKQAQALLNRVGLAERSQHSPTELSGGQRQRVAIARALVTDPSLILADEPTGNLDSRSSEEIIELFEEMSAAGKTIIIVTHDLNVAKRCKRILHIRDGKIEKDVLND